MPEGSIAPYPILGIQAREREHKSLARTDNDSLVAPTQGTGFTKLVQEVRAEPVGGMGDAREWKNK